MYEPAVALVKTEPKVPDEFRPLLSKRLIVEVNVAIDNTGRVTHAEAISQKGCQPSAIDFGVESLPLMEVQTGSEQSSGRVERVEIEVRL